MVAPSRESKYTDYIECQQLAKEGNVLQHHLLHLLAIVIVSVLLLLRNQD